MKLKDLLLKEIADFDPGLKDAYLIQAVQKVGSTLTPKEVIELLMRKYGVSREKASKAIEYANHYKSDLEEHCGHCPEDKLDEESNSLWRWTGTNGQPTKNIYLFRDDRVILFCDRGVEQKYADLILRALNAYKDK